MFPFSSKIAAIVPLSLLVPSIAAAQEATPAPAEDAPQEPEAATASTEEAATAPPEEAEATAEQDPVPATEEPAETTPAEAPAAEASAAPEPVSEEPPSAEVKVEEPPAPTMLPIKLGTSTWSRFEYRQNYDKLGVSRGRFQEGDSTYFRARLTIQTNPLQLTKGITGHIYFAPQATGQWGTQGAGGTVGEAELGMYEGYFQLTGERLSFKMGRFAMKYGDLLVIGDLDWHQSGRAFDGMHTSYKAGKVTIDAFLTQTSEGSPALNQPFMVGDNYFWGVYGQFGPAIAESLALDFYALGKSAGANDVPVDPNDPTQGTTHVNAATFVTLGARAKQKVGLFDYRFEAGVQLGKTPSGTNALNKMAYQSDLELGLSPTETMRIAVGGAVASGDDDSTDDKDNAYDELYPTTHKWLGLMDVIGFRTNVATANFKFNANLAKSTILKVDGHVFARLAAPSLGRAANATSNFAGYEVDTQVIQKIGKFAYARGLYGMFLPNKDHYGTSIAAYYVEVQSGLQF